MQLTTDALSSKGRGLNSEKKIEVIGALPGEEVLIQLGAKRKKKQLGYLRGIVSSSSERVAALCSHAPECGGCAFQHWGYPFQLAYKQKVVKEEFEELIGAEGPEICSILSCEQPWQYRNKMEFSFSQNREGEKFLGLMLAGARGRVLHLKECHLVSRWFTDVILALRAWWEDSPLSAYHHRTDEGHLRTVTLRESKQGEGKMVMLTVSGNPTFALKKEQMASFVRAVESVSPPEGLSIFVQIQQIGKGRPTQFFEMPLKGPDHITEQLQIELGGESFPLQCKISPTSFFQPNTRQAERLYSIGLNLLQLEGAVVYDLYCGSGLLGLAAARKAKEVVGIELNHHSVFDAGWNKEVNGVENFTIFRGDVGQVLEEKKLPTPDVVIVDPPRAGLDEKALKQLIQLSPREILYISCNPKTQAENCASLIKAGYRLAAIQPVDQFPHTPHIENIVLLQKG